jgi:hypothetical protein
MVETSTEKLTPRVFELSDPESNSEARVTSQGTKIQELVLGGIKILTSVTRGDNKRASTHPCSPNFGPPQKNEYGDFPQHGTARDLTSEVQTPKYDNQGHADLLIAKLKVGDKTLLGSGTGSEKKGLSLIQFMRLGNEDGLPFFGLTVDIRNESDELHPSNFGEHFYFDTPQGWDKLKINGKKVRSMIKTTGFLKLGKTNIVEIPGKPRFILELNGFDGAVLWAYKNPDTGEFDTHYVCIEPVEKSPYDHRVSFGSEKSLIEPHSSRTTQVTIRLLEQLV